MEWRASTCTRSVTWTVKSFCPVLRHLAVNRTLPVLAPPSQQFVAASWLPLPAIDWHFLVFSAYSGWSNWSLESPRFVGRHQQVSHHQRPHFMLAPHTFVKRGSDLSPESLRKRRSQFFFHGFLLHRSLRFSPNFLLLCLSGPKPSLPECILSGSPVRSWDGHPGRVSKAASLKLSSYY